MILITVIDGCEEVRFDGYTWPETDLRDYASIECPCFKLIGSQVHRYCGGSYLHGAHWSNEIDDSRCVASDITRNLCQAANVRFINRKVILRTCHVLIA